MIRHDVKIVLQITIPVMLSMQRLSVCKSLNRIINENKNECVTDYYRHIIKQISYVYHTDNVIMHKR